MLCYAMLLFLIATQLCLMVSHNDKESRRNCISQHWLPCDHVLCQAPYLDLAGPSWMQAATGNDATWAFKTAQTAVAGPLGPAMPQSLMLHLGYPLWHDIL